MDDGPNGDLVKDLHRDLGRKFRTHATTIKQYWRSFDQKERTRCLKAGAADGMVLRHSRDTAMGNVYKFIPELNLRDIANPQSDFLLDLLEYRATTPLRDQYATGRNGGLGDCAFIRQMMETRNLRLASPPKNGFTLFVDEERYGQSMTITQNASEVWAGLEPVTRSGWCVPQELGQLVLYRQLHMLQTLNILIDDILDIGSVTRDRKPPPQRAVEVSTPLLFRPSATESGKSLLISDLIDVLADRKAMLEDYMRLTTTEPVMLARAVNFYFFTRSELVPDEKGRILPVHTDRYISGTVLDVVYNAVKATTIWDYLGRLLQLLVSRPASDKVYRAILLQEISNICHLEYSRSQALFRRSVQNGVCLKRFKRLSNVYNKAGDARVVVKADPEALTRSDPHVHYLLRLCQTETDAIKAREWMRRLSDHYGAWPAEWERLDEREADSLSDFATTVTFVQHLSAALSLPPQSRKKNQTFVTRAQELDAEMSELKSKIDLGDGVAPIDNLTEPGVASQTLVLLDHSIVEHTGTKLGFLCQDALEECLAGIERQYVAANQQTGQSDSVQVTSPPPTEVEVRDRRVEQRRRKEKTRPSCSAVFEIAAGPQEVPSPPDPPAIPKVQASTAKVFSALFEKALSRGSVSWSDFVSAMADVGFSVQPKTGSVYTFLPPASMGAQRSLTLHRPHKSKIESYHAIVYARRLKRVYGWSERTFAGQE